MNPYFNFNFSLLSPKTTSNKLDVCYFARDIIIKSGFIASIEM